MELNLAGTIDFNQNKTEKFKLMHVHKIPQT